MLGTIAWLYVTGQLDAVAAVEAARWYRGDGGPVARLREAGKVTDELRAAVEARTRSEQAKWQAAYNVLAWDADVKPRPDKRRGLRPEMAELYRVTSATENRQG